MAITLGQKAKFIEHFAVITDEDSRMEFAGTAMMIEGCEDVEEKVETAVIRNHGWMFAGNSISAEYHGETGRTVMAEVVPHPRKEGRLTWSTVEELTPATEKIEQYNKM